MFVVSDTSNALFLDMLSIIYLRPKMISFDKVDFVECCYKGVISFFRRSLYENLYTTYCKVMIVYG